MREYERAVGVIHVLVEAEPRRRAREQAGERRLAHRERTAPQILPVELDQVERIEEHIGIMAPVPNPIE